MSEKLTNEQIIDKARLSGLSMDVIGDTQAKLKAIFPQCFKEGKLDIDQLLNECGEWIDNDFERYKFEWHGKVESIRHSQRRSSGCLRPYKEESVDWDNTENLYIEGDNLEVLKLLQSAYYKKVKMIYIDPPYNTGNDFIYEDDYTDSLKAYLEMTDQQSSNPETSGRFHTKWLNMMYPRLRLASNLLRDDGVIFVSIDDNEVTNLRKLMDEVFGEENFEADIIVVSNPGGRDYKQVAITHEHILIYSKSDALELNELPAPAEYKFTDSQGGYNTRELRNRNPKFHSGNRPNLFYPFYVNPNSADKDGYCAVSLEKSAEYSIEVSPYNSVGKESVWRWGKAKASENIIMGDNDGSQILAKQKKDGDWNIYEKNRRSTTKVKSLWNETEMRTEDGTRLIRALFDNDTPFDHPKPLDLVKRCIRIGSSENDIILD
ncbi:MAG: site-specific DNA-methyltransferase, partial [Clostridiales bacterium]|nr:site-specific DNA-methyltransferase [Clostridiales bacterium]